jgi:signal transduction histidine kinase
VVGDLPGRRLRDDELALARAVASVVQVGLENAELHEEARRRLDALTAAQSRLVQRERLAALGELSAVMAHEVRNPLGVIFNSLGSIDRLLKPTGDAKMLLDIVREESDRLNRIVSDLLDFARPVNLAPRPVPVDRLLDEAWNAAATASNGAAIEVRREIDPALPMIEADSRLLRQALVNVMVNAIQALPHGGSVTLRARAVEMSPGQPGVDLEVEDTGAGLGNVDLSRVFEPFFTSKATGTGLGLAVVRRIIEEHGGTVSLRPGPQGGAVFTARLPVRSGQGPFNSLATPADGLSVASGI